MEAKFVSESVYDDREYPKRVKLIDQEGKEWVVFFIDSKEEEEKIKKVKYIYDFELKDGKETYKTINMEYLK